jgi:hypothetical protein
LAGRYELGVKSVYLTGNPADPSTNSFTIWRGLTGPGESPPENPGNLRGSFYTKRKKDLIDFGFGDSGKRAFFAAQIENEGKKGPGGL